MPLTESKIYRVNVSSDALTATLSVNGDTPPDGPIAEDIIKEVGVLGIIVDEQGTRNIEAYVSALNKNQIPEPIIIAQGTPPTHDKNGRIEKLFDKVLEENAETKALEGESDKEAESVKEDTSVKEGGPEGAGEPGEGCSPRADVKAQSHYERSSIINVKKDQPLIRIIPPDRGTDGTDVYGKPIPRKLGREAYLRLGNNVRQEEDIIYADTNGKVECTIEKIWVDEKLEIKSNVDFSVGNIDFDGDIEIPKNILDLFKVCTRSSITVRGVIEAACVHADLDINGLGGMTGKEKGEYSAGRDINAKYITNAKVQAGRNITVYSEVVHCDLVCNGMLTVENGPLVGGRSVVKKGLKIKHLGSEAGTKTLVEVGVDADLKAKYEEVAPVVKVKRIKAQKVRQTVEPLMRNQKHLNSEQKEKATELLYMASELEEEAEGLVEELRQVYQKAEEESVQEIEVTGRMYAGVTIRFPRVEAVVTREFKGPLKIVPRKVQGVLRVVAIESENGSTHTLDTGSAGDDFWEAMMELLAPPSEPDQKPA
ncbi:MAG: DUF342 domain-containing protein [Sedimentisphaerales bacterium]|nr:DUF342 domain-containing protein [Sedimentisphaerales bacterium]